MIQTYAIFLDAYRELRAKRLFWFVLVITALVVGVFSLVDINEAGLVIAVWEVNAPINTTSVTREFFYKQMFINLGVKIWLTYAATILALISTAGVIPDFLAGGAIELSLSKPISRVRLFLTKYAAGLLFVGLQVLVFSIGAFLIIGVKGGAWEPGLFLAVPIVLAFFSYLYCVCALFGLLTRSTIASLLLTLLVWLGFFGVGTAETIIYQVRIAAELNVTAKQTQIAETEARIHATKNEPPTDGAMNAILDQMAIPEQERRLESLRGSLDSSLESQATWTTWHNGLYAAKTLLPKTAETIELLERHLITQDELTAMMERASEEGEARTARRNRNRPVDPDNPPDLNLESPEVQAEFIERRRARPIWWVLGSSLAFEAVILALGCFIFTRKDF